MRKKLIQLTQKLLEVFVSVFICLEKSVVFSKVQFGMFKCSKASVLVVIDDPFGA